VTQLEHDHSAGGSSYADVQASEEFQGLRRTLRRFVFPATALFLAWYLLYVLLTAYARGFMAKKVLGEINVAYVLGLLQFVSTFVIAWVYSRYAAKHFDPTADRLRARLEGEGGLSHSGAHRSGSVRTEDGVVR
jgi:uncharacterized membrane protein (DUF485 family)